ncbi:hypothetical protein [Actinomadura rubrisoli]|uniref:DUF4190 domain-containing protein n=1 Tax=Actinomadura rubrisoli TaxID=2530368 RepID=A0A4R4ZXD0_9ACTN|nr:hypothetical protein [Actinomadura rubrisoli]TDD61852.1 hypothetical protein E1298_45050 [Actinomadura rubrisoli]
MTEQPGSPAPSGNRPEGRPEPPEGPPPVKGPASPTGWRALWLGAFALLTAIFFYPLGLVLGVAALVLGIRARRAARRTSGVAPGATAGIVLGSAGLAVSALAIGLTAFLWPEMSGYQECLGNANTHSDKQSCRHEYFPKMEKKMHLPSGSMDKYGDLF